MIKKNFKKKIPSFRHKVDIKILHKYQFNLQKKKKKKILNIKNLIKRQKKFFINKNINLILNKFKYSGICIKLPIFIYKPYKMFFQVEDLSGYTYYIGGVNGLIPGKSLKPFTCFSLNKRSFLIKGNIIFLEDAVFNLVFCNISNFSINKVTYAKSSGTFSRVRKFTKKKKKLILILLPSKLEKYLPYKSTAFIGKNKNFYISKVVEGKFGTSYYQKKKINVRGVAMNPVDHPNGGRTKTNKPEKSPWGWVAKFYK